MLNNKFVQIFMVVVVLMSSFGNSEIPSCMDSLITNPFVKLSLIYFTTYSILNNHSTALVISVLIYVIMDNENKIIDKPIDEEIAAEITLENEITQLENDVSTKDEISKELEQIESQLEEEVVEEEAIEEESESMIDQQIKEVINIKSSRGMTDNCEECSFIKSDEYSIKTGELTGYDINEYYNIN